MERWTERKSRVFGSSLRAARPSPAKAVTEYRPAISVVAFGILGLCAVEVKPGGLVKRQAVPATADAVSETVSPTEFGAR